MIYNMQFLFFFFFFADAICTSSTYIPMEGDDGHKDTQKAHMYEDNMKVILHVQATKHHLLLPGVKSLLPFDQLQVPEA